MAQATYLGGQDKVSGDASGGGSGKARVLEGVNVQQVSRLGGELDGTATVRPASLHKEGVVVLDELPDQSRRHGCRYNRCKGLYVCDRLGR